VSAGPCIHFCAEAGTKKKCFLYQFEIKVENLVLTFKCFEPKILLVFFSRGLPHASSRILGSLSRSENFERVFKVRFTGYPTDNTFLSVEWIHLFPGHLPELRQLIENVFTVSFPKKKPPGNLLGASLLKWSWRQLLPQIKAFPTRLIGKWSKIWRNGRLWKLDRSFRCGEVVQNSSCYWPELPPKSIWSHTWASILKRWTRWQDLNYPRPTVMHHHSGCWCRKEIHAPDVHETRNSWYRIKITTGFWSPVSFDPGTFCSFDK